MKDTQSAPAPEPKEAPAISPHEQHVKNVIGVMLILFALLIVAMVAHP